MAQTDATINILLATFAGLDLPRTLSLPTSASTPISDIYSKIFDRLPVQDDRLLLTTVSNKQLRSDDSAPITTLLSSPDDSILSIRLSRRLCGGKGGFGSQLRAAGGRMSSRKNRNSNTNPNGSNRNLDGRRLRTVDEAKRLADYLAIKPEMERKEKEERKKRWQEVVEAAERRVDNIKSGLNTGRLDAQYVEQKEEAEEKTRQAVLKAMKEGMLERTGSESSMEQGCGDSEDGAGEESSGSSEGAKVNAPEGARGRSVFGWDEEEDDSDEDDEEPAMNHDGKGKGKVT